MNACFVPDALLDDTRNLRASSVPAVRSGNVQLERFFRKCGMDELSDHPLGGLLLKQHLAKHLFVKVLYKSGKEENNVLIRQMTARSHTPSSIALLFLFLLRNKKRGSNSTRGGRERWTIKKERAGGEAKKHTKKIKIKRHARISWYEVSLCRGGNVLHAAKLTLSVFPFFAE